MSGYRVNGLDCSAEGMERLRNQREAILIAYVGSAEETAESILAELVGDVDSAAWPDGVSYHAAREAVAEWAANSGGLAMIASELRDANAAAERGDLNWNDESASEFDSVAFRLYVEWPESAEFPRLSVCDDCCQAVANGLDSIAELEPSAAALIEAGIAREQAEGGQLVNDCEPDCEGAFSWSPCELCQRPEGGARHRLALLPK